jgi:hypothetical protein
MAYVDAWPPNATVINANVWRALIGKCNVNMPIEKIAVEKAS